MFLRPLPSSVFINLHEEFHVTISPMGQWSVGICKEHKYCNKPKLYASTQVLYTGGQCVSNCEPDGEFFLGKMQIHLALQL